MEAFSLTPINSKRISSNKLGLGTWSFAGDSYGAISEDVVKRILFKAMDLGIHLVDTSPTYGDGRSETLIGKYADKQVVRIATKVGMVPHKGKVIPHDFSRNNILDSVDKSLKRLNLDRIHLLQLHSPLKDYLEKYSDLIETLEILIKSGRVEEVGISLRSPEFVQFQLNDFEWASVQFNCSLLDQRVRKYGFKASESNSLVIARTVLNFGFLTSGFQLNETKNPLHHLSNWPQDQIDKWSFGANAMQELSLKLGRSIETLALRYPIDSQIADLILVGANSAEQLTHNQVELDQEELSQDELEAIHETYKGLESTLTIDSPYTYKNVENAT